jgi:hypothetical protein
VAANSTWRWAAQAFEQCRGATMEAAQRARVRGRWSSGGRPATGGAGGRTDDDSCRSVGHAMLLLHLARLLLCQASRRRSPSSPHHATRPSSAPASPTLMQSSSYCSPPRQQPAGPQTSASSRTNELRCRSSVVADKRVEKWRVDPGGGTKADTRLMRAWATAIATVLHTPTRGRR